MADSFKELGLRPELVDAAERAGWDEPAPLQDAAVPVLRRGGNAVLRASAGAGLVACYGLPLLDRLAGEDTSGSASDASPPRALVLVTTAEQAARVALSLAELGRAVGLRVAALSEGWRRPEQRSDVLVAEPGAALGAVETSRLKLDGLDALVIEGAAAVFGSGGSGGSDGSGGRDAVETLTEFVPREAQRVLATAGMPDEVEDYVRRSVRLALTIPRDGGEEAPEPSGPVHYIVAAEEEKLERTIAWLDAATDGAALLHCRTAARADNVADALRLRGFEADSEESARSVTIGNAGADAPALGYDVPFDANALAARHAGGGAVVVLPRELVHLRTIAARAGLEPQAAAAPRGATAGLRDGIDAFRERLRNAARTADLGGPLLVLEPLFEEFSAVELAAAASALLRHRGPPAPAEPAPAAPSARPASRPATEAPQTWTRLFMSIGERDDVRPGNLVGAITGEAGVDGGQIGRIDIGDTHSIVEVESGIAGRVIEALNGTTIKSRSVRVDYDRR